MKFIILFEDNPDIPQNIRQLHMQQNLQFLEDNADTIRSAGPLFESDGNSAGGLWIVDVEKEAEIETLIHTDPFWETGLRKSHKVLKWRQVFENGVRLING